MATTKSIKSSKPVKLGMSNFMQSDNIVNASKISDTQMLLNLEKGSFAIDEVWYMKGDNNQEYVVMPQNILKKIITIIRDAHEEKIYLELARDITQNTPIDFDDVMAVALRIIESKRLEDGSLPPINTKTLVKKIKAEYPNLFFDLTEHLFMQGSK